MTELQTLLLGLIAGGTIFLGIPIGRLRVISSGGRQILGSLAVGVLIFLLWDVLDHAYGPLGDALTNLHTGSGGFGPVAGYGSLFLGGIGAGMLSLAWYEGWLARRRNRNKIAFGPGAMARTEFAEDSSKGWTPGQHLSFLIAVGIGLHNFGEGLAIGGSAAAGAIGLATVLVIGFGLHNATEGFGIVAPLAKDETRPSWGFLGLMGLIGGGPTFLGTVVGRQFSSAALSTLFLTLAAGSILYVVVQLIGVAHKNGQKQMMYLGIFLGLVAGFVTDMIVTAGGS